MEKLTREEAQKRAERLDLPAGPLSFTQIETYLKCQRQYYLRYIAHIESRFSLTMNLGSAMHTGLEIMHKGLIADTRERTQGNIFQHMDSGLRALRSAVDMILRHESIEPTMRAPIDKQGKCLEELLKLWTRDFIPELDIVGAEEKFYCMIGDTPMNIRIDLRRKNRISDFKLSKKDKSERDADNSLQLAIYAMTTELDDTSFITLRFPAQDKLHRWEPSIKEVVSVKKAGDKNWAIEVVRAITKSLSSKVDSRSEYYPPCNPSDWLCSPEYCDSWEHCRGKPSTQIVMPSWISSVKVGKGWKPS